MVISTARSIARRCRWESGLRPMLVVTRDGGDLIARGGLHHPGVVLSSGLDMIFKCISWSSEVHVAGAYTMRP